MANQNDAGRGMLRQLNHNEEAEQSRLLASAVEANQMLIQVETMSVFFVARMQGNIHLAKPVVVRVGWKEFGQMIAAFIQNTLGNLAGVAAGAPPPPDHSH